MSANVTDAQLEAARKIVAKADESKDGLAALDVEKFWADQKLCLENPWNPPQMTLGIYMSSECVFDELGIPEDWYRIMHDSQWRASLCREYNDKAEKITGRRLLGANAEKSPDKTRCWPGTKALHDIFEAENVWHNESYWLKQSAETPADLEALLARVEKRLEKLRDFILPANWEEEKTRLKELGVPPPRYRGQRGPVTFATSIYGAENLIYLIVDNPELAARFRDLILKSMIALATLLDEEAGDTPETSPRGFYFCDDNCCLLNPDFYEFFGYPVLKGIFERFSPSKGDMRGQHSDSAMGHLLPLLGKLGMTNVNLGPTLTVTEIRRHLPGAIIQGQLAPFTFSRDERVNTVAELLRDFEMSREGKGVSFSTAGSINNGSRLSTLRLIMHSIQNYCRY
ncbi:MAG: hypothetical protein A2X49_09290 [Lentisphaerae bacterium GWF2_52_8]|nr:MAG: hypothetical protein A2X49_09290 [Lentisphaerae bacterium GWF2_52_8]